jgi:hypothetical protein
LLAEEMRAHDGPSGVELGKGLESVLVRFAESGVREQMAGARACYREVEFLVEWSGEQDPLAGAGLHGLIDCVWQDDAGAWHLLVSAPHGNGAEENDASWPARHPALVLAAWTLHRLHGAWPQSLTLYCLDTGRALTCRGKRVQQTKVLAAARAALRELRSEVVADE